MAEALKGHDWDEGPVLPLPSGLCRRTGAQIDSLRNRGEAGNSKLIDDLEAPGKRGKGGKSKPRLLQRWESCAARLGHADAAQNALSHHAGHGQPR